MGLFDAVGRLFGGRTNGKKKEEDIPPFQFSSDVVHAVEGNPAKHWKSALPSGGGHVRLIDDTKQQLEVPTRREALRIVQSYPDITTYQTGHHRH